MYPDHWSFLLGDIALYSFVVVLLPGFHLTFFFDPLGEFIIGRRYILRLLLIPAVMIALIAVHLVIRTTQKHTQFPGPGRTEHNAVGSATGSIRRTRGRRPACSSS